LCGIDHCEAGRSLLDAWSLPEAFLEITACHHEREARPPGTASLIPPSCELPDALGFSVLHCRSPRGYADILADFPERARTRFPTEAELLALETANEMKAIETA